MTERPRAAPKCPSRCRVLKRSLHPGMTDESTLPVPRSPEMATYQAAPPLLLLMRRLLLRRGEAMLTWRGPALMLFARTAFAVGAQAVVAAIFALRAAPTPWHDAEPWLQVYGTLIDGGCLALLWRLTGREGIGLFDLVGFKRAGLLRDVWLGLALIPRPAANL